MFSSHRQLLPSGRAIAWLLGLAALLASAWAVAPALSAKPYLPEAKDFEQRLPTVARLPEGVAPATAAPADGHDDHPGEGAVTHRSEVIAAPARFDAVGLAREMRPLEIRARDEGGEWGDWIEIANGDPAWFGGAGELQLRARGWRPEGNLHYVNVSGDATPAEGALNTVRKAVNGAVVSAAGLLGTEIAGAEPPAPDIIGRGRWGANDRGGCKPRSKPSYGRVRAASVHHTVNANNYTRAEAPGMVLAICRYHRNANGWDDIGYNALVDRFGRIYAGRAGGLRRPVIGAHAEGVNSLVTGVAALGTHERARASKRAIRGLTHWLAWKLPIHGKHAAGRTILKSAGGATARYPRGRKFRVRKIIGHRRTNLTSCPGTLLNRQLGGLRKRVQNRIKRQAGA